uniref:Potassium calcium-activated channel subfamily M regulatory beta subunit 4 n=1 Tax=Esox lucius TaxID=8010 RepID=A0AAY5KPL4_ESOLU
MAKMRVSYEYSEAEDKSIRLGLFLIVCGILSLFILGFCWLSPTLQSMQSKPANCTVVSVLRPEEMFECVFTCGTDCKGTSLYPCLQIFVNNSESNSLALLHFDEKQLVLNPKGFSPETKRTYRCTFILSTPLDVGPVSKCMPGLRLRTVTALGPFEKKTDGSCFINPVGLQTGHREYHPAQREDRSSGGCWSFKEGRLIFGLHYNPLMVLIYSDTRGLWGLLDPR